MNVTCLIGGELKGMHKGSNGKRVVTREEGMSAESTNSH